MSQAPKESVAILGMGRVGLGLALALKDRGHPATLLWSRRRESAEAAEKALGAKVYWGTVESPSLALPDPVYAALKDASLVFIATNDGAILAVAEAISSKIINEDTIVAHLSGLLPAAHLPGKTKHLRLSMHPLLACPSADAARQRLPGAFFALEGDAKAKARAEDWLEKTLGARHASLSAEDKPRYHAAAVMAANLSVALFHQASRLIPESLTPALLDLALGALEQCRDQSAQDALTGPVKRGDVATVQAHLEALAGTETLLTYRSLSRVALEMARDGLTPEQTQALRALVDAP